MQSSAVPVVTVGILVCDVQSTEPGEVDVAT